MSDDLVVVPRWQLDTVLRQALDDNNRVDGEFSCSLEDRARHSIEIQRIYDLAHIAGINLDE